MYQDYSNIFICRCIFIDVIIAPCTDNYRGHTQQSLLCAWNTSKSIVGPRTSCVASFTLKLPLGRHAALGPVMNVSSSAVTTDFTGFIERSVHASIDTIQGTLPKVHFGGVF